MRAPRCSSSTTSPVAIEKPRQEIDLHITRILCGKALSGMLQEMLGVVAVLTRGRLADTASHFREAFLRYTSAAGGAHHWART